MEEKRVESVYSNQVNLGVSVFDISFQFSFKKDETDQGEIVANIIMSPQHAKAFANVLMQNVQTYENVFGKINIEPNPSELDKIKLNSNSQGA